MSNELQKYAKFINNENEVAATKAIVEEDDDDDVEVIVQEPRKQKKNNKKTSKVKVEEALDDEIEDDEVEEIEILTSKDEAIVKKAMSADEIGLRDLLVKFKNYINGKDFDTKCSEAEKKSGIKKAAIQNKFIRNVLGTIADVLNLTISIVGDIIVGAVKFLNSIIQNVVNFTSNTIHKLINLLTLNCGSVEY